MTDKRRPRRARAADTPDASASEDGTRLGADAAELPDSLGTAGPVQAVPPAARDPVASDIERADESESGSIEALAGPEAGGGIAGFVEPQAAEDEGEASKGDPWI